MRLYFATDVHGSEVCWRKFLNAGAFHKADVLIMGGDMTGKAMVPIVATSDGWELSLQDQRDQWLRQAVELLEWRCHRNVLGTWSGSRLSLRK